MVRPVSMFGTISTQPAGKFLLEVQLLKVPQGHHAPACLIPLTFLFSHVKCTYLQVVIVLTSPCPASQKMPSFSSHWQNDHYGSKTLKTISKIKTKSTPSHQSYGHNQIIFACLLLLIGPFFLFLTTK